MPTTQLADVVIPAEFTAYQTEKSTVRKPQFFKAALLRRMLSWLDS